VAARAQDQVQLVILNTIRSTDLELPYSAEKRANLAARLDPLLGRARQANSGIIRLNVFARDGTILYSDMASLRGQTVSPVANELLARALSGVPGTEISSLAGAENTDLHQRYGRALEAYVPLKLDGQVVGVYEFYEELGAIEPIRPVVWSSVAAGSAVLCVALLLGVFRTLRTQARPPDPAMLGRAAAATNDEPRVQPWQLTRRESEVLRLMAEGLTYPQIASRLVVDEETVRSHAKGVLRKLGQSSRSDAVLAARKAGLL